MGAVLKAASNSMDGITRYLKTKQKLLKLLSLGANDGSKLRANPAAILEEYLALPLPGLQITFSLTDPFPQGVTVSVTA